MSYNPEDLTPERIEEIHSLATTKKVSGMLVQEWEVVALCERAAAAPKLLQALLELCAAVGQHEDSMTADGPLHAPMLKAADVAIRASPPPKELTHAIEVPMETDLAKRGESNDEWYEREKAAFIAWWEAGGQQKFSATTTMAAGAGWLARAEAAA